MVQASHACIEATKAFLPHNLEHPNLVVIGVENEPELVRCAEKLDDLGVRFHLFVEPDKNNEFTALATEPVSGKTRRVFRDYQLLQA